MASLNTNSGGKHWNAINCSLVKRRTSWRNISKNRTVNFLKSCILNSLIPLIICTKFQINQITLILFSGVCDKIPNPRRCMIKILIGGGGGGWWKGRGSKLKEIWKESKLIVNLSSETLTEYERSLLKKSFKFCPATKSCNKVNFVRDITSWFRNLRIREYFSTKAQVKTEHNSVKKDTERSSLNWYIKKDGYPSNDNKTLEDYITKVANDIETMVSDFKDVEWNNLSQNERQALK